MFARVLLIVCALLLTESAAFAKDPFKGTKSRLRYARRIAIEHDYTFLRSGAQVRRFVRKGLLVQVPESLYLRLAGVSYPFARPEIALFLERLSGQYFGACGEELVVTSLTRPTAEQPRNASRDSVHPTGMAADLRVPLRGSCRAWLEENLLVLQKQKVAVVTRERYPPHYHIAVFPRQYLDYLKQRGVKAK